MNDTDRTTLFSDAELHAMRCRLAEDMGRSFEQWCVDKIAEGRLRFVNDDGTPMFPEEAK